MFNFINLVFIHTLNIIFMEEVRPLYTKQFYKEMKSHINILNEIVN